MSFAFFKQDFAMVEATAYCPPTAASVAFINPGDLSCMMVLSTGSG